jgi:hypothetical protein
MSKHPMQPIELCGDGIVRFKPNRIVQFLVDWAQPRGMSLNDLARLPFDNEDRSQLAQLIGYSVSGFGELSYTDSDDVLAADLAAEQLLVHATPAQKRGKG